MRRLLVIAGLAVAAMLTTGSALAAETFHFRGVGSTAAATYTNFSWEGDELTPGDYFYTDIWASQSITTADGDVYEDAGICVWHEEFTIDASGEWTGDVWFGNCISGADLSVSRRLTGASLVASIPIEDCLAWDDETGECTDSIDLGTVLIDLTLIGEGQISRYHGTGSGGSAGNYQYAYHGTGSERSAIPSGTVVLVSPDGSEQDLTGGLDGTGYLSQSRDGYVEVIHN